MMHAIFDHQPSPTTPMPEPGTYIPNEVPLTDLPPGPSAPPEVNDPNPSEPTIPIREPAVSTPLQAVQTSAALAASV